MTENKQAEAAPQWQSFVETVEAIEPGNVLDGGFKLLGPAKFKGAQADLWIAERDGASFVAKFYRSKEGYVPPPADIPDHPNIVGISGRGEFKGRPFEVSPFHPNGSIDAFVKHRPLTDAEAESVLADMCRGLAALHAVGIQHRDLKPANLLVVSTNPLRIALADFGSAGHSFTTTLTGVKGTLLYSAPEATDGQYSPKSDLWSLGVIFLELLLSKHPLEGMDNFQQSYAVKAGLIPIPDDLTAKHKAIIDGLLAKKASDRFSCEQILQLLQNQHVPSEAVAQTRKPAPAQASGGGISLVEITAAMVILTIVATACGLGFSGIKTRIRESQAIKATASINQALVTYRAADEKHTIADGTATGNNLYDSRNDAEILRLVTDLKSGIPTTAGINVQTEIPDKNGLWELLQAGKYRLHWTGKSPDKRVELVEVSKQPAGRFNDTTSATLPAAVQ